MGINLLFIHWNPDQIAFSIGAFSFRWYSLCWLVGLVLAYIIVKKLYKEQKIKEELFEPLFIYCFLGILIGARLGHCLFYEPAYFLSSFDHVIEMFLPIHKMADGSWKFTGYEGLASHGGTLGLMIALFIYCRNTKVGVWQVLDNIAIATPVTACFIRLGNLMNSEIILDSSMKPSPTFCFSSSDGIFIVASPKKWEQVSSSDCASRLSSPLVSSSNSPKSTKWTSKTDYPSIWGNCSPFPLSSSVSPA